MAGKIVAHVLEELKNACQPGVTTKMLDDLAARIIESAGGRASFYHYRPDKRTYPAHICTSINDEVVHGIPGRRALSEGDLVGVDVGVYLNGFHADSAATFPVGQVTEEARRLLEVTEGALYAGIAQARLGRRIGHISAAIQKYAESNGFFIVKNLVGHGVGRSLHEDPQIPNYGDRNSGDRLQAGMTLAIEPMINAGTEEVRILPDHWTIITEDGSLSAHFEHTIAITRDGPDILTLAAGVDARKLQVAFSGAA